MIDTDGRRRFIKIQNPAGHGDLVTWPVSPQTDQLIAFNIMTDFGKSVYRPFGSGFGSIWLISLFN
ncbi:hypothetical protein D3C71_1779560 [compost metagenome]